MRRGRFFESDFSEQIGFRCVVAELVLSFFVLSFVAVSMTVRFVYVC